MLNLFMYAALAVAATTIYGITKTEEDIRKTREEIEKSSRKAEMIPNEMFLLEQKQKKEIDKILKDIIEDHPTIKLDDLDKWER